MILKLIAQLDLKIALVALLNSERGVHSLSLLGLEVLLKVENDALEVGLFDPLIKHDFVVAGHKVDFKPSHHSVHAVVSFDGHLERLYEVKVRVSGRQHV